MNLSLLSAFRRDRSPVRRSQLRRPQLSLEALEDRYLLACNAISGTVYYDQNNNGLRDAGEPPIANSVIELRNAAGTVVGTTMTDANGYYVFDKDATVSTSESTLTRTASVPTLYTDWTRTLAIAKFDPSLGRLLAIEISDNSTITSDIKVENTSDQSPNPITGTTSGTITLTGPGLSLTVNPAANAGTWQPTVYDGTLDFGGTSGRAFPAKTATASKTTVLTAASTLAAFSGNGNVNLTAAAHATSSATGGGNVAAQITTTASTSVRVVYRYVPNNCLQPGKFTIVQTVQPPGYTDGKESVNGIVQPNSVGTDSIMVMLMNGDLRNNNFGETKLSDISGYVYVDANNNGVREAGELPIANVTIMLTGTDDQGAVSRMTTTGQDGFYFFVNLRPGTYTVKETQPAGYDDGKESVGSLGGVLPANDVIGSIPVGADVHGVQYNFGEIRSQQILPIGFSCPTFNYVKPQTPILSKLPFLANPGGSDLDPTALAAVTYVDGLYRAILGRPADAAALLIWVPPLLGGVSRLQIVNAIWNSAEHRNRQVDVLYEAILKRPADAGGRGYWANFLLAGATEADIAQKLFASAEYAASHGSNEAFVRGLYLDILLRGRQSISDADVAGWVQALDGGASRESVAAVFLHTDEYYARILDCAYVTFLGRNADPAGKQAWLTGLRGGQTDLEQVYQRFLASEESFARAQAVSQA